MAQIKKQKSAFDFGELETVVEELKGKNPNWDKIKQIAQKNGFPFKRNPVEQIDLILGFLDGQRFQKNSNLEL